MIIGDRLRELREAKKLSQGHIEEKTGLLRCYISRVENGHTVPAVETLEKFARALEIPMCPAPSVASRRRKTTGTEILSKFRRFLGKMDAKNRGILLHTAAKMARPAARQKA